MEKNVKRKPTNIEAILPLAVMIIALTIGVGFNKLRAEPIILMCAIFAGFMAHRLGYSYSEMQEGIIEKITSALPATLILWSVGLLIGSWMYDAKASFKRLCYRKV